MKCAGHQEVIWIWLCLNNGLNVLKYWIFDEFGNHLPPTIYKMISIRTGNWFLIQVSLARIIFWYLCQIGWKWINLLWHYTTLNLVHGSYSSDVIYGNLSEDHIAGMIVGGLCIPRFFLSNLSTKKYKLLCLFPHIHNQACPFLTPSSSSSSPSALSVTRLFVSLKWVQGSVEGADSFDFVYIALGQ